MITVYVYSFVSVVVVSLISLVGVFTLSLREEILRKYIFLFISLAVGALLGDAFIHLIPEALKDSFNPTLTSVLIISGILLFFIIEKFLHWHHHGEDKEDHQIHSMGKLVLFSDGIHNFIDGMIIGASFLISIPIGLATTLAVILHEIPQEIGDFAVLIHAGYSKNRALWLNFLSALLSFIGLIIALVVGEVAQTFNTWLLPVAAGGFIYIAVADLIPELHKTKEGRSSVLQLLMVVVGILTMVALTYLE
ncbi:MAG: ZIP family metal transporter [bacterium]|nr:ZIP family metal transporter [bacterium]